MILDQVDIPIVQAPMGGGPSTLELARAVAGAGALGFLASSYLDAEGVREQMRELSAATRNFGVNLFVPDADGADSDALARYAARLEPEAARYGAELGEPAHGDDDWDAKLEVLREERPPLVSFTFGCPAPELIAELREAGIEVWVTVTSPAEARAAADAGADALVVQGAEAGGHRGSFEDPADEPIGLLALLRLVAREVDLPLVASGGIADGAAVAAVLAGGARAAQVGTAFMLAPEAGTTPAHRRAIAGEGATGLTRAFSGRLARGIVNRFQSEHSQAAPSAYPHVNRMTGPLRAAARAAEDADGFNLWAGQPHTLAREEPAADTVKRLWDETRAAVRSLGERYG